MGDETFTTGFMAGPVALLVRPWFLDAALLEILRRREQFPLH
jgi:hypothetical protein